ncbi:MAG: putative RNA methyltransferase [Pseudonocardiaceae bacterium]
MSISTNDPLFACPVCGEPLPTAERSYVCGNGHRFDVAREGYVNLLLAQHRRSKDPGYSKGMIAGRRDFLDAGHYAPLADGVAERVRSALPPGPHRVVVDAGCGEGYYLRRLRHLLEKDGSGDSPVLCGLDISKHGIRVAARRDPEGLYAVAGTYRMPIRPARVDVLLTHFSPVSPQDFRRVVKPGGLVLVGGPGERHLFSFKKLVYESPAEHEPTESLAEERGFELIDTHVIHYHLSMRGRGQVANLLLMTPYLWSINDDMRARLAELDALDTEVHVVVHTYRRTAAASAASK